MVKDTEIRKGNLLILNVNYKENIHIVDEIYTEEVKVTSIEDGGCFPRMKLKSCNPIQITTEWLERCGFIGLTHLGKKEYSLEIDDDLTIEVCFYEHITTRLVITNSNDDENIDLGDFVTYRNISNCKHIHQLQNLYFALTCVELTIKK